MHAKQLSQVNNRAHRRSLACAEKSTALDCGPAIAGFPFAYPWGARGFRQTIKKGHITDAVPSCDQERGSGAENLEANAKTTVSALEHQPSFLSIRGKPYFYEKKTLFYPDLRLIKSKPLIYIPFLTVLPHSHVLHNSSWVFPLHFINL